MTKLLFGCGYLGHRVARAWQAADVRVTVVTRSQEKAATFAREGFEPIVADILRPEMLSTLPAAETVLFAVGYDRRQSQSIGEVYAGGLRNVLDALSPETRRIIYISSTGVHGDTTGEWVDEDSPCDPQREGGLACLAAEKVLAAHPLGSRGIVLRLAGIYGLNRIPRRDDLLLGKPIPGDGDAYLNLIHVNDAVRVTLAAEAHAKPPRTFLVSDGNPAPRIAYHKELARLIGAPPPRFEPPASDQAPRSRGGSNKRVQNLRMLAELAVELQYPSFREGLAEIMRTS